jgi:16S rRNA (uracil1498-N3)-methyltransferase
MQLFYTPDFNNEDIYFLNEEESKHAIRVLRLKLGDEVWLTDGLGNLLKSVIIEEHAKKCGLKITQRFPEYGKRNYRLHLAVAPTKNIARFEWFLEKATEIGVDEITPILCEHSERDSIKIDRLNKVISAAVKQSLKAYHPKLNPLTKFSDLFNRPTQEKKLLAWCKASPENRLENNLQIHENVIVFIGPEGGFSDKEIDLAKKENIRLVSISSSRLRTETAAIVACNLVAFINKS